MFDQLSATQKNKDNIALSLHYNVLLSITINSRVSLDINRSKIKISIDRGGTINLFLVRCDVSTH